MGQQVLRANSCFWCSYRSGHDHLKFGNLRKHSFLKLLFSIIHIGTVVVVIVAVVGLLIYMLRYVRHLNSDSG
jgi:hypothetical protein